MATIILGDIVEVIKETVHNPQESGFQYFVGLEHYDSGEPLITRYATPDNLTSSVKHFAKGDILVARRNVYLKRASLVDFEGVTSGDSIVLRAKDKKYQQILPFILNSDDFWDYAEQNSDGTMSKRLSPADLLDYEFEEPENIELLADKLWAAYRVKDSYKKLLAATDDMLKAKFMEMFRKEKLIPLKEVCETLIDGDWIESKHQTDSGIRLIQTGNIGVGEYKNKIDKARFIDDNTFNMLGCKEVLPGDILISRLPEPVGRACIIPEGLGKAITAVDCTIIRLKKCLLSLFFIGYTKTDYYNKQIISFISGTTRLRISRGNLETVKVPLPPLPLQQQFVEIATQAEATKESLRKSIENIDQVIKSLINQ